MPLRSLVDDAGSDAVLTWPNSLIRCPLGLRDWNVAPVLCLALAKVASSHGECQYLPIMLQKLSANLRFALSLSQFLRQPISVAEAQSLVERQLAARETS